MPKKASVIILQAWSSAFKNDDPSLLLLLLVCKKPNGT
jgi:hypothetical protein